VTAVFFGLATALAWAATSLASTRASRIMGAAPALAWVSLFGLLIAGPIAILDSRAGVDPVDIGWLGLAGVGNVIGLLLLYMAVRRGKVGIAVPIASTEGAIAAAIAVIAGEAIAPAAVAVMGVVAVGVVLATLDLGAGEDGQDGQRGVTPGFVALVVAAALVWGISLYARGRVAGTVPAGWLIAAAPAVGVVLVTLPTLARRRLVLSRAAVPWLLVTAAAEMIGGWMFILGARVSISVTAVLASQFAAIAAVGAYFLFGERLSRVQRLGVALICIGVAAIAVLQRGL
jgi:drug/metabolite transporter (DMT)-like permease